MSSREKRFYDALVRISNYTSAQGLRKRAEENHLSHYDLLLEGYDDLQAEARAALAKASEGEGLLSYDVKALDKIAERLDDIKDGLHLVAGFIGAVVIMLLAVVFLLKLMI